jgi:hypothetical protein
MPVAALWIGFAQITETDGVNLQLQPGNITEGIEVSAAAPVLQDGPHGRRPLDGNRSRSESADGRKPCRTTPRTHVEPISPSRPSPVHAQSMAVDHGGFFAGQKDRCSRDFFRRCQSADGNFPKNKLQELRILESFPGQIGFNERWGN